MLSVMHHSEKTSDGPSESSLLVQDILRSNAKSTVIIKRNCCLDGCRSASVEHDASQSNASYLYSAQIHHQG